MSFRIEARRRLLPHAAAIFLLWPIVSIFFSTVSLYEHSITSGAPVVALLVGSAAGAARMAPEWLVVGSAIFLVSVLAFAAISAILLRGTAGRVRPSALAEPFLLALAGIVGVVLEYPAVVRHPALSMLRGVSVATETLVLGALAIGLWLAFGWQLAGRRGAALTTAAAAILILVSWRASRPPAIPKSSVAGARQTVLFGIDSLAQTDEVSRLRADTVRLGGVWYEKPVPPGLLTNSVWSAIVMRSPVAETGVFLVFQTPDWDGASFNLIKRAREKGCRSFAFFSSQFTNYVGKEAGFQVNRSGPRGWLQLATAYVKDGSVFLPLALPRFRAVPGAISPANQVGTFSYDLRGEIHSLLTAGACFSCSLVAAHLTYLHETAYPSYTQLGPAERRAVREARAGTVRDFSLEWQPPRVSGDPLRIEEWKLRHLQSVLVSEIENTRFLAREKSNHLVLFSDHGNRRQINDENFGDPRYARVLLTTFGVPPRDPTRPVSLLDIPEMVGLGDGRPPADPVVEYANATSYEWTELLHKSRLLPNGRVLLDRTIVEQIGKRLKGYRPYSPGGYFPVRLRRRPPI